MSDKYENFSEIGLSAIAKEIGAGTVTIPEESKEKFFGIRTVDEDGDTILILIRPHMVDAWFECVKDALIQYRTEIQMDGWNT